MGNFTNTAPDLWHVSRFGPGVSLAPGFISDQHPRRRDTGRSAEASYELRDATAVTPGQGAKLSRSRLFVSRGKVFSSSPPGAWHLGDIRSRERAGARVTTPISIRNQRGKADPMSTRSNHLNTQSTWIGLIAADKTASDLISESWQSRDRAPAAWSKSKEPAHYRPYVIEID